MSYYLNRESVDEALLRQLEQDARDDEAERLGIAPSQKKALARDIKGIHEELKRIREFLHIVGAATVCYCTFNILKKLIWGSSAPAAPDPPVYYPYPPNIWASMWGMFGPPLYSSASPLNKCHLCNYLDSSVIPTLSRNTMCSTKNARAKDSKSVDNSVTDTNDEQSLAKEIKGLREEMTIVRQSVDILVAAGACYCTFKVLGWLFTDSGSSAPAAPPAPVIYYIKPAGFWSSLCYYLAPATMSCVMAFLRKLENAMQLEEEKTRGIGTSVDSEEEQMCADIKAMREEMKRIHEAVDAAGALVVLYGTWKVLKWMFC
ncbi:hypothetical protein PRIPAC_83252 [Pristionchus pacificus]|uniref:Uncharacterized protein n=1 Tax=Pristionchus pacificus TaxID=54126 RepID=A0A454XKR1_PRIPA|nr:hypothetical protein PRIPAC_83252 [Pristionchus pacificus]|eukprot:PDM69651.1 hypothetical protein PRIPAC_44747 [Pristionchus pacificus]